MKRSQNLAHFPWNIDWCFVVLATIVTAFCWKLFFYSDSALVQKFAWATGLILPAYCCMTAIWRMMVCVAMRAWLTAEEYVVYCLMREEKDRETLADKESISSEALQCELGA